MAPAEGAGSIARGAGSMAAATILSRITGFARDAAILAIFGASGGGVWVLAWTLPNAMRRLLGEGSLTISFVPLFVAKLEHEGPGEARCFLGRALGLAAAVLLVLAAAAVLLMPQIVGLLAPSWRATPEVFGEAVRLARIAFPYLFFVGLVALAMGVLNSVRRFFVPAVSPAILNLSLIAGALLLSKHLDPPLTAVAWAALFGGLLQVLLVFAAMAREGFPPLPRFDWRDPTLKKLVLLMAPATFGASIHQVNILLSRSFAASVGQSAVAWLYAADRLIELPLGLFAVSIAVASLPNLSRHAARKDHGGYVATLQGSLGQLLFVVLPAAAGLAVLARPLVATVFQRGAFSVQDTEAAAMALVLYSAGLPFVSASRVVVQGFYALEDTRTPVAVGVVSVLTFGGSAALLTPRLGHLGIAAASSLAAAVNLVVNLALLRRKVGRLGLSRVAATVLRCLPGLAAMAVAAHLCARLGVWEAGATGLDAATARNVAVLGLSVLAGALAYAFATVATRTQEAHAALAALRRRLSR